MMSTTKMFLALTSFRSISEKQTELEPTQDGYHALQKKYDDAWWWRMMERGEWGHLRVCDLTGCCWSVDLGLTWGIHSRQIPM